MWFLLLSCYSTAFADLGWMPMLARQSTPIPTAPDVAGQEYIDTAKSN